MQVNRGMRHRTVRVSGSSHHRPAELILFLSSLTTPLTFLSSLTSFILQFITAFLVIPTESAITAMGIRNQRFLDAVKKIRKTPPAHSSVEQQQQWIYTLLPASHVVAIDGSAVQYQVLRRNPRLALQLLTLNQVDEESVGRFIKRFAEALNHAADEILPRSPLAWFFEGMDIPRHGRRLASQVRAKRKKLNKCVRLLIKSRHQCGNTRIESKRRAGQSAAAAVPRLSWQMTKRLVTHLTTNGHQAFACEHNEADEQIARFVRVQPPGRATIVLGNDTDYLALTGAHGLIVSSIAHRSYAARIDLLRAFNLNTVQFFVWYAVNKCDNVGLRQNRANVNRSLAMVRRYPLATEPNNFGIGIAELFEKKPQEITEEIQKLWISYHTHPAADLYAGVAEPDAQTLIPGIPDL